MPALLFFDIDGTLITLDESHRMPDSTRDALLQAKANGHKIFINTGRVKTAIDRNLRSFAFDGMVCGCGTYIEYEGKELFHAELPREDCKKYADALHAMKYQTVFEGKDRLYMDGDCGKGGFMEYIYDYFSKNVDQPIGTIEDDSLCYDKFTTSCMPDSDKEAFHKMFDAKFNLIPHGANVIEAVPGVYSKATGIRYVMEYFGAELSDCYAFGDSINDMEMLQYVPHAVGMGNAVPEVLQIVEYQTTDVLQDGISNALKHYGLI